MRTVEEAKSSWSLFTFNTLSDLQNAASGPLSSNSVINRQRSACWKVFLIFKDINQTAWCTTLKRTRDAYTSLKDHYLQRLEHPDEIDSELDPLSDTDNSPWEELRKDEVTRQEIYRDVERCMPENLYFREPSAQSHLLEILFIWTKLNPDIGYRQGMHELLATVLWVVHADAIHSDSSTVPEDDSGVIRIISDASFIEHDAFTLFAAIMQNAKPFYEMIPTKPARGFHIQSDTEISKARIVSQSQRIIDDLLARTDPLLTEHLRDIEIVPQVFLMRWIRLLFGREFSFEYVLNLWDNIFAHDVDLQLVDEICVAMILRIRWRLIESDHNAALTLLLHYPEQPVEHGPWTLVQDAKLLTANPGIDSGNQLIEKYTGRVPAVLDQASVSRLLSTESGVTRSSSTASTPRTSIGTFAQQASGIESILQEAARGVMTQGEKWGVNKAVRDAAVEVRKNIGEVRKNVKELQSRHSRNPSLPGFSQLSSPVALNRKIEDLQSRNQMLAKMLESALNQIWKQQSELAGLQPAESESVKAFIIAAAKVQMVQTYLADPSIPIPEESIDDEQPTLPTAAYEKAEDSRSIKPPSVNPSITPSVITTSSSDLSSASQAGALQRDAEAAPRNVRPRAKPKPAPLIYSASPRQTIRQSAPVAPPSASTVSQPSASRQRPSLAQSSFSFMLGQPAGAFAESASPFSTSPFSSTMSTSTTPLNSAATSWSISATGPVTSGWSNPATRPRHRHSNSEAAFLFGIASDDDLEEQTTGSAAKGAKSSSRRGSARPEKDRDADDAVMTRVESRSRGTAGKSRRDSRDVGSAGLDEVEDVEVLRLGTWKRS